MQETVNRHLDSELVFRRWGRDTWEAVRNLKQAGQKLSFIEGQLLNLLHKNRRDSSLIDFCVRTLELSHGRMSVKELERQTGYTRRYLDLQFKQYVGFCPKVLARIFRFQKFYRKWAEGLPFETLKEDLYTFYYDQAHFTKEFKRMTGYSPRKFTLEVPNEFGRRLSLR